MYPPPRVLTHISRSAAWSFGDRRLACDPHVSSAALNDVLPRASFPIREDLTGLGRDTLQSWRTVAGMTVRLGDAPLRSCGPDLQPRQHRRRLGAGGGAARRASTATARPSGDAPADQARRTRT